jgi:hypothetical protein
MADFAAFLKASGVALLSAADMFKRNGDGDDDYQGDELDDLKAEVLDFEIRLEHLSRGRGLSQKKLTQKEVLAFNRLLQIMERCDAIKVTDREMYDRENRGREIIRRCNKVMDKLDAIC